MGAKNWEVGSTWFSDPSLVPSPQNSEICPLEYGTLLSSGRSAIGAVLDRCGAQGVAIVPQFTCDTVLHPFLNKGFKIYGYSINPDLTANIKHLEALVNEYHPSVVLIHGYFGFNNTMELHTIVETLKENNIIVIEDQTQNMFSSFNHINPTYRVGSIRKWLPIPDGAFVSDIFIENLVEDKELSQTMLHALVAKGHYILNGFGNKDDFMPLFARCNNILSSREDPMGISEYSKAYMASFDWETFKQVRKDNYIYLVERLQKHPEIQIIHKNLQTNEIPFLLPVYIENDRLEFQKFMAQNNVFPTIIWSCPTEFSQNISNESQYIYDNILCFHIDQRYDTEDMRKVADIVDAYFKR